jgi:hypothetical protein
MRAVVLATLVLVAVVGSSCGCSCGAYRAFTTVMLTAADSGKIISLGLRQSVGVLLPAGNRTIRDSDPNRLTPYPSPQDQPPSMTLEVFGPNATEYTGKLFNFGGTVVLSSPAAGPNPEWQVTVVVGSDPLSGYSGTTYLGAGTTVMLAGQSFVISWPVGGKAPTTSDPSVLAPFGPAAQLEPAFYTTGEAVTFGAPFMQQLFVASGLGTARLASPDTVLVSNNSQRIPFGPSQDFIVTMAPAWECSLEHGCMQLKLGGPVRPDHYYPAGATPSS